MHDSEKLAQLTESLQALTEAVASNEKRYQRLEAIFRWIGVGLVVLFATAVLTHFEWIDRSYANTSAGTSTGAANPPSGQPGPEVLMGMLMSNLTPDKFKTIVDGMVNAATMMNRMSKNATDENIGAMMEGMGNAAVLVTRLKQDSDVLRAYVLATPENDHLPPHMMDIMNVNGIPLVPGAGPQTPMPSLEAMAASPAIRIHNAREALRTMANELHTMAYSMGSTMGRMGSWMP